MAIEIHEVREGIYIPDGDSTQYKVPAGWFFPRCPYRMSLRARDAYTKELKAIRDKYLAKEFFSVYDSPIMTS